MSHQYATLEDTVYLGFAANDTSGSGVDGTTPLYDVRLGGAAASAAPTLSGTPDLLTHANYGPGAYEVAVAATAANGFAAGNTYLVYVTLTADSQTPAACIGSFHLGAVPADVTEWLGTAPATPATAGVPSVDVTYISGDGPAADNMEADYDGTGYNKSNSAIGVCSGAVLSAITHTGAVIPTVTTLTGHTAQTGDSYARLGAPAGADLSADIAAVKVDTAAVLVDTGTAGVIVVTNNDKAGYSISGTKTTLDALNDPAATDIVSSGAITTSGGAVSTVTAVTNETTADVTKISGSGPAADNLEASALAIVSTTVNDASATTTSFVTALTEATDDHYNGRVIVFTSGAVSGQATTITDYTGSSKTVTVTALTEAPANGVSFVIV